MSRDGKIVTGWGAMARDEADTTTAIADLNATNGGQVETAEAAA